MTLQETKEYTKWLIKGLALLWLLTLIVNDIYSLSTLGRDDSDQQEYGGKRSGLVIRTDYKTGGQFYESKNGTLTPRLDGYFNQLGCK